MRRVCLAIVVAVLSISASGASSLVVAEPCTGDEQRRGDDRACPPTCVTCGCCAQAVEPVTLPALGTPSTSIAQENALAPRLPNADGRDILHVPKPRLA